VSSAIFLGPREVHGISVVAFPLISLRGDKHKCHIRLAGSIHGIREGGFLGQRPVQPRDRATTPLIIFGTQFISTSSLQSHGRLLDRKRAVDPVVDHRLVIEEQAAAVICREGEDIASGDRWGDSAGPAYAEDLLGRSS
jgi:hypothetical protein